MRHPSAGTMNRPSRKVVEETLISRVLGWPVVAAPDRADEFPCAYWSDSDRCFCVTRDRERTAEPFSPVTCFSDAWEVRRALDGSPFRPALSRPLELTNVRVVADLGSREVVVEGRSLSWSLSLAIYRAAQEGLLD